MDSNENATKNLVLLPCPFCGSNPQVEQENDFGSHISCPDIDCPGYWSRVIYDFEKGVQLWNSRDTAAMRAAAKGL